MKIARRALLSGAILAGFMPLCAFAQEPVELKLAWWLSGKGSEWTNVVDPWRQRVEAASGGTLKITPYVGGTLGRDPSAQMKMIEDGVADIAYPVPAYTPNRFPDSTIVDVPGTFNTSVEASTILWQLYEDGMLRGFDGLKVLAIFGSPPFSLHSKQPTASLADISGQKVVAVGKYAIASAEAFGATPVGLTVGEWTEALTRGVIDAIGAHPNLTKIVGADQVAKHHYMIGLSNGHVILAMSQAKFDALPDQAKAAIDQESGRILSELMGKNADTEAEETIADWKKPDSGHVVTEPSAEDRATMDGVFKQIAADWEAEDAKRSDILKRVAELKSKMASE